MKRTGSKLCLLALAALVAALPGQYVLGSDEPIQRTGSRTGSDATSRTVVPINPTSEITHIRRLLDSGETEQAVALARDYLKSLDSMNPVGASPAQQRYDALNALCAALTKADRLDEAVNTCTQAIDLRPSIWSAVNNRGTAQFMQRNFVQALEDYRRARELADDPDELAAVEHNIALAEAKLDITVD